MDNWKTNLAVMAAKERQYMQQCANYKVLLVLFVLLLVRINGFMKFRDCCASGYKFFLA